MKKRVFIVHGWGGDPEQEIWFPWLRKELEQKGFEVFMPTMPDTDNPKIEAWVAHLASVVRKPDDETYFVGHSIGCQTILRYLETIDQTVGAVVLVTPWFSLTNLESEEVIIAKPWCDTPLNFAKVRNNAKNITAIFSDDDPLVPLAPNKEFFEKNFGAKTFVESGKGHFSAEDNTFEVPHLVESLE